MRSILKGLTVLLTLAPTALVAQANCADRGMVVEKLASGYGEAFAGGGLQNQNRVFEVWFSEEKGTWTILMTKTDGTTCIMASGTNWHAEMPDMKQSAGIQG